MFINAISRGKDDHLIVFMDPFKRSDRLHSCGTFPGPVIYVIGECKILLKHTLTNQHLHHRALGEDPASSVCNYINNDMEDKITSEKADLYFWLH